MVYCHHKKIPPSLEDKLSLAENALFQELKDMSGLPDQLCCLDGIFLPWSDAFNAFSNAITVACRKASWHGVLTFSMLESVFRVAKMTVLCPSGRSPVVWTRR